MNVIAKTALLAIVAVLLLPASNAAEPAFVAVDAVAVLEDLAGRGEPGADQTFYDHYDCVGPGLPGTPGPHTTHTSTVSGLQPQLTTFSKQSITIFGAGICHVALGGPVLEYEFTGSHRVRAVCGAGTLNSGTVWVDWETHHVAGVSVQSSFFGTPCIVSGSSFSVQVTISIDSTSLLFLTLEPHGGIRQLITQ